MQQKTRKITFLFFGILLMISLILQVSAPNVSAGYRCYARDSYAHNLIIAVQETIKKSGFDPGKIDGRWGPKTAHGVRKFQQSNGLKMTGDLDGPTLRAIFGDNFNPVKYGLVPNPEMPQDIFDEYCR